MKRKDSRSKGAAEEKLMKVGAHCSVGNEIQWINLEHTKDRKAMGHIQHSLPRAKYSQVNLTELCDTTTGAVGRHTQMVRDWRTWHPRRGWDGWVSSALKRREKLLLPTNTWSANTEGMDPNSYQKCTAKGWKATGRLEHGKFQLDKIYHAGSQDTETGCHEWL